MPTTNDVKEQLQQDLITLCFAYNSQIPEDLINELCQVVADWECMTCHSIDPDTYCVGF